MSRETDVVTLSGAEYDALIDELQGVKCSRDSWVGMYKVAQERAETAFERAAQVADTAADEYSQAMMQYPQGSTKMERDEWAMIASEHIAAEIRKLKEGK